ncbi:hypothetical protein D051_3078 [Vibrio parahaemolyticus VPCR-2010]|nr:hypothetical protein D051_3078 [Vibrio parahaemolyticus VPCR-2010]
MSVSDEPQAAKPKAIANIAATQLNPFISLPLCLKGLRLLG